MVTYSGNALKIELLTITENVQYTGVKYIFQRITYLRGMYLF